MIFNSECTTLSAASLRINGLGFGDELDEATKAAVKKEYCYGNLFIC